MRPTLKSARRVTQGRIRNFTSPRKATRRAVRHAGGHATWALVKAILRLFGL